MGAATILLVDDEPSNLESLSRILEREGYAVATAENGKVGLDILRRGGIQVMVTDLVMPQMTGVDLLKAAKAIAPDTEVVVISAYGTIENAVEAMKQGAYDFVTKPLKRAQIVRAVKRALEKQQLTVENRSLREQLEASRSRAIVGNCFAWRSTIETLVQAAPSSATVLLLGESGTGKELLARAVHENSGRASGPFVPVNCAAIPETILEAELFGYERGAFTGAVTRRDGRFSVANGGTLFLDEVGEISPAVQVKLLRVLQDGQFDRLGGKSEQADIRLVAATNKDLADEVSSGRFREDLYYRLNVITVPIPPLRDRADDIPLLADHFLRRFAAKNGRQFSGFTERALKLLARYSWPGNVRELENAIERAVVLGRGSMIDEADLPAVVVSGEQNDGRTIRVAVGTPLEEVERRLIYETLRQTNGDKRPSCPIARDRDADHL